MHMQGEPQTMQADPRYEDVVAEVVGLLAARAEAAMAAGVARTRIWLDPGIGFGKTLAHNLVLLAHLDRSSPSVSRSLLGVSRKRSCARSTRPPRTPATGWAARWPPPWPRRAPACAAVRVHDVRETVQALAVQAAIGDAGVHD